MPITGASVTHLNHFNRDQLLSLFTVASQIRDSKWKVFLPSANELKSKTVGLIFLEPSSRTTTSFEMACLKMGIGTLKFDASNSSLKKGESLLHTCQIFSSLGCDMLVVRHGTDEKLEDISQSLQIPIISAGESTRNHPTQGLLDAYTIFLEKELVGFRLLMVGDVKHSRVASSNIELLKKLGADVSVCGPSEWLETTSSTFHSLEEGLKWCDGVMMLRTQLERHTQFHSSASDELKNKYQLNRHTLKFLKPDGLILHPGPFNLGSEITSDVLTDARCRIWDQVENGLFVRAALIANVLGVKFS